MQAVLAALKFIQRRATMLGLQAPQLHTLQITDVTRCGRPVPTRSRRRSPLCLKTNGSRPKATSRRAWMQRCPSLPKGGQRQSELSTFDGPPANFWSFFECQRWTGRLSLCPPSRAQDGQPRNGPPRGPDHALGSWRSPSVPTATSQTTQIGRASVGLFFDLPAGYADVPRI